MEECEISYEGETFSPIKIEKDGIKYILNYNVDNKDNIFLSIDDNENLPVVNYTTTVKLKEMKQILYDLKSNNDFYFYLKSLSDNKKLNIKKGNDKISLIFEAKAKSKKPFEIDLFSKMNLDLSIKIIFKAFNDFKIEFDNLKKNNKELKDKIDNLENDNKKLKAEINTLKSELKKQNNNKDNIQIKNKCKKISENKDEEKEEKEFKERSYFSLEGAKYPLSMYTRRVMDTSKMDNFFSKNSSQGTMGGKNLGNTCFINSAIACLSNCTELTYYFLKGDYIKDINKNNKLGMHGKLAEEWGNLIYQYWVKNIKVGDPSNFINILCQKEAKFKGSGWKDSFEFINSFLLYIHEDLNKTTNKINIKAKEKYENETDEQCARRFWELNLKNNNSIINDLFCGQYKTSIICPMCGWMEISFENFYTLNIPLFSQIKKHYFSEELIKEFDFYYIPNNVARKPICLKIKNISVNETISNVIERIKKEKTFFYHDKINDLLMVDILRKNLYEFAQKGKAIRQYVYDEENLYSFDYNSEKDNILIPAYFYKETLEEENKSRFPRMIICQKEQTLNDIRKKIYFYLRKFILSPFLENKEKKDRLSLEIEKYLIDKKNELPDDKINKMIEEEYNNIFKYNKGQNYIEQFKSDIPFEIFFRGERDEKFFYGKIPFINSQHFCTYSKMLIEFLQIKDFDSHLKYIQIDLSKLEIIVQFNSKSKYINKNAFDLDHHESIEFEYNINNKAKNIKDDITLAKCLEKFCEVKELEDKWYCQKCKNLVLAKKKIDLYYVPKILIICLKRFVKTTSKGFEKNETLIDFPINNLDLKDFIIGPDKEHSKYDLFANNQHFGSGEFGHYTALCKNNGKWFLYDDSQCNETLEKDVISSAAYVLFYRRQTD